MLCQEFAGDACDQRLEAGVEAVFPGVQRTVPCHDPTDVARPMLAQQPGGRLGCAEQGLDALHRGDQRPLRGIRKAGQQGANLLARSCIERGEGGMARLGQGQPDLAPVGRGWLARKQAVALEALEDAAEIAEIEPQFPPKFRGREVVALGEFVEHARLGQREAAGQQALLQDADDARVAAGEPPDGGDAVGEGGMVCHDQVIRLVD